MKRWASWFCILAGCAGFAGCASNAGAPAQAPLSAVPASVVISSRAASAPAASSGGSESLVRQMMELDYTAMPVDAFNKAIVEISERAGTNIFAVIADLLDSAPFSDAALDDFLRTTLDYSSAQIFGEPVYIGTAAYITLPGLTAQQVAEKRQAMVPAAWEKYLDARIADATVYVTAHYTIEFEITDGATFTVAQRDARLNAVRQGVLAFMLEQSEAGIAGDEMPEAMRQKMAELSAANSGDDMRVECTLERWENAEEYV